MSSLEEMQRILNSIMQHVSTSGMPVYGAWRIGLTNDAQAIYEEWNRPARFVSWEIGDLKAARAIETFFAKEKGMISGITGELDDGIATAVYIFSQP